MKRDKIQNEKKEIAGVKAQEKRKENSKKDNHKIGQKINRRKYIKQVEV